MKKKLFASFLLVPFLALTFYYMLKPATIHVLEIQENIRVIVHFDESIIMGTTINTPISGIHSENIRKLLLHYKVKELKAVYRNRYNQKGLLKQMQNKGRPKNDFLAWQEIIMSNNNLASELVNQLNKENSVLAAYIEKPILLKPCTVPTDAQYVQQWHLNSNSNPNADIRAEQAWDINKGRNDVIIAVCDGGIDYTHTDLDPGNRSHIIAGYDSGDDDNDPMDDLPSGTDGSYAGH